MSLVVSWIGIDTHGYTSAYIASESRASWKNGQTYDCCRKTFFSNKYPEIIGYCGDILFPSLIISNIIESIDKNLIFTQNDPAIIRFEKFKKILFNEFHKYPKVYGISSTFEIIYINRDIQLKGYPSFYAHSIKWTENNKFYSKTIKMPIQSGILHCMGLGNQEFTKNYERFQKGKNKNTTRNVYHCFSYTLKNFTEKSCGGPPQLVSIIRKPKSTGFSFGLIYQRKRYYNGLQIKRSGSYDDIQWRNDKFEICEGMHKQKINLAKSQPSSL